MNKYAVLGLLVLAACSPRRVEYIYGVDGKNGAQGLPGDSNDARVADLESRLLLNEELDALQTDLINANSLSIAALAARVTALEEGQVALSDLLDAEQAAREAGDDAQADALASEILNREAADALLQAQIDAINASLVSLNSSVSSLQSDVSNHTSDIASLQSQLDALQTQTSDLSDLLDDTTTDLQTQIDALEAAIAGLPSGASVVRSTSACTLVEGDFYMKNDKLYEEDDSSLCDGNHDKVSLSNSDSHEIGSNKLAVKVSGAILVFSF